VSNVAQEVDRRRLQGIFARLRGLYREVPTQGVGPSTPGRDFDSLVAEFANTTGESSAPFRLPPDAFYTSGGKNEYCRLEILRARLGQLVQYMEDMYNMSSGGPALVGGLYNSITDEELKRRCSDLLSAPGDFDRVINQATLVLEDRIRQKANPERRLSGVDLVNAAINSSAAKSILVISNVHEEHEGIAHICRGIMQAFRNPTHHHITDHYTREDALKVCAFIDNLLKAVDGARVQKV
jgi:hypothetical protein